MGVFKSILDRHRAKTWVSVPIETSSVMVSQNRPRKLRLLKCPDCGTKIALADELVEFLYRRIQEEDNG